MRAYFTSFIVLFKKGHGKDWFKYLCLRQYRRSWYDPVKSSSHPYQMNPFIHDDCLCLFFGKKLFSLFSLLCDYMMGLADVYILVFNLQKAVAPLKSGGRIYPLIKTSI